MFFLKTLYLAALTMPKRDFLRKYAETHINRIIKGIMVFLFDNGLLIFFPTSFLNTVI